jgi:hypothetical protein
MPITTIEEKEEIAKYLKDNWQIIDIAKKFNVCFSTIRKINKIYNCCRKIPSEQNRSKQKALKIEKIFTDKYGVTLNLEALEYFKEKTKKYFNPMLCDKIIGRDKRPYEIQYHITHDFVNVSYIYQDVNETFKYKFINDFYKNKLTKENLKELITKKNIFETIIDKDNNKCIFDLDLFLNDVTYKEAVNLSNITKVAPKI